MKFIVKNNLLYVIYDDGNLETIKCAIGTNGIIEEKDKREGDSKTPAGTYELLDLYYRKDKVGDIECGLPSHEITDKCGWSDDVNKNYNEYVTLPFNGSHEELCRDDIAYDIMITTSHNTNPAIAPMGSAIFFHVARYNEDGSMKTTAGCIAIDKKDMIRIVPKITKGSTIEILKPIA